MKECAEVGTVGEVLSLATSHVDDLNDLVEVQSLEGAANVLDIVKSEQVVTVLTVQAQIAHMMAH